MKKAVILILLLALVVTCFYISVDIKNNNSIILWVLGFMALGGAVNTLLLTVHYTGSLVARIKQSYFWGFASVCLMILLGYASVLAVSLISVWL